MLTKHSIEGLLISLGLPPCFINLFICSLDSDLNVVCIGVSTPTPAPLPSKTLPSLSCQALN